MVLAFGLGRAAAPGDRDKAAPKKEAVDELVRVVKRAVEAVKEQTPDAGDDDKGAKKRPMKPVPAGFSPSPEPEKAPDAGLPEYRKLPTPDNKGGTDKHVVVVEVHEIIDMGISAHLERAIEDNPGAAALILDINTPGGRVDAATLMRDAIMAVPKGMRTVAFIHPRAISAGAFISFACDLIFIADGGSMGAATPISLSGGDAQPVDEKMVSYFRTEMATTARAKGRRGDIAEAMVDAEIEIKGITPAGKLLTLDTAGALRHKIADAKANSLEEVLELLALGGAKQKKAVLNWAEELARVFTHPIISGILMSVGVLGILIELYQPGFGLPGIVGITCLIIFFTGHMVVNLAGFEEVLLFVIGVGLLAVEVFITPGFGVLGAAGVLSVLISLVLAMSALPVDVSFSTGDLTRSVLRVIISLGASVLLFFGAFALLPRTRIKSKIVLETAIEATASGGREGEVVQAVVASGQTGVAESFLRPAGIARFGNKRVDVLSEGDFIEQGAKVEIVRVSGNHVVVKKCEDQLLAEKKPE
jgi:membrane-bound serine protease (ClpP class)